MTVEAGLRAARRGAEASRPGAWGPRGLLVATTASLATALLSGCPRDRGRAEPEDDRLQVGRMTAELHAFGSDGAPRELDTSLEGIVRTELGKAKAMRPGAGEGAQKGARLKVRAVLSPDGASGDLHAIVSARLDRTGSIPLSADIDAVRPAGKAGGEAETAVYVAHLEKAVREVIESLDGQVALLRGGSAALVKALSEPEPSVRVAAARELGERRSREGVEPLCELLGREEGPVGEAAVGALAAIGDERGVPCIIRWAGTDDRRTVLVLDPLASVGGEEARAFLEMVASGHENPGIRNVAENALGRAREGGSKGPSEKRR